MHIRNHRFGPRERSEEQGGRKTPGRVRRGVLALSVLLALLVVFQYAAHWSKAAPPAMLTTTAAPAWTELLPGGPLPAPRDDASAVYDSANNTLVLFGGNATGCTFSPSLNDTWLLTNANGLGASPAQWTQVFPSGPVPGGRRGQTAVYDQATDRMIVFGGDPVGCAVNKYNDTWVLLNASGRNGPQSWVQLSPAGSLPPARSDHSAVYDQAHNRMIIAGGFGPAGNLNDVWVLTNANGLGGTPTWLQLSPVGGPPSATGLRAVAYDAATNTMIVFGGTNCCNYVFYNETWLLTNANGLGGTPQWIRLTPSGTAPCPRAGASAIYNAATNTMTIFGGGGSCGATNDTWALTNANGLAGTPAWSQLSPSGNLPAPRGGITADPARGYDAGHGSMIIFGGNTPNGLVNDTWVLSFNLVGASLVVNPTSGPPGTKVSITGTGFQPREGVNWFIGTTTPLVSGSAVANGGGVFHVTTTIPAGAQPFSYIVSAVGASSGAILVTSFTVTGGAPLASLVVNPTSGPPGTQVTITGTGFQPGEGVNWFIGTTTPLVSGSAVANGGGVFHVTTTIPAGAQPFSYIVSAVGASSGAILVTSFTVT